MSLLVQPTHFVRSVYQHAMHGGHPMPSFSWSYRVTIFCSTTGQMQQKTSCPDGGFDCQEQIVFDDTVKEISTEID